MTEDTDRNPGEQRILDDMAERRGRAYVEQNEELILAQARRIGSIPDGEIEVDEIGAVLADGALFELTSRDEGGDETTRLVTHHEIERPSAKPIDGTLVFGFRPIVGGETFTCLVSAIVDIKPVSIERVPAPLWGAAMSSLVRVAEEDPERISLSEAATVIEGATNRPEAEGSAFELTTLLLEEDERAPDEFAGHINELLTAPAEPHWSETSHAEAAARCLATLAETEPGAAFDAIPQLSVAAETGDLQTRRWTMYAFSTLAAEYPEELFPALHVLIDGLHAEDDGIRANALSALGRIVSSYPDPAGPITDELADLLDSEDAKVRANATGLLGDLASEQPRTVIRHATSLARRLSDEAADARRNASIALVRACEADPQALRDESERVEEALDDDLVEVRRNACSLIGNAEPSIETERLRVLRNEDPDEIVRDRAGWALERLG